MSSLVREMVAKCLKGEAAREHRRRVAQFSSVRAGRSKQNRLSAVSEKHGEAVAAAFEK